MRINCPIIGDRYVQMVLKSSSWTQAEKKQIIQWRWESAYCALLRQPMPGFYKEPPEPPRVDPMKMNRRRQLRVPLLQQRPRDGCR